MRIPKNISLNKEGQYCFKCFAEKVQRVHKGNLTYYHCATCNKTLARSLVIDNKIVWWVDEITREYWHESVGIFLINEKKEILLFKRTIYPFAYAIPAGHLDTGEKPLTAVKREVQEETGLNVKKVKLFSEENLIGDKCRRGADNHHWHLYTAHIKNDIDIKINDEGMQPVWMNIDKALTKNLVFPVQYFIKKYRNKLLK